MRLFDVQETSTEQTSWEHRPDDDLESFIWVLVWAIIHAQKIAKTSRYTSLEQFNIFKSNLLRRLKRNILPSLAPFRKLLLEWLEYSGAISEQADKSNIKPSNYLIYYKPIYARYLSIGFEALSTLPHSWDDKVVP
jgi:hypothetical protein